MQSMTGFGHSDRTTPAFQVVVDLKTVNSRYFDFKARLPRSLIELENQLKSMIQQRLPRGRVDLYLELRPASATDQAVNVAVVQQYLFAVEQLREMGIEGRPAMTDILQLPGVLALPGQESELDDSLRAAVVEAVQEAVDRAWESRHSEGRMLKQDLEQRLAAFSAQVDRVAAGSGTVKAHFRDKFEKALQEWSLRGLVDETRLLQEVALYVEKSDISEELARLESHRQKFQTLLGAAGETPVGRDLDFLCQEMNREVNTILAKSAVVEVTTAAVEAKGEIERIREQVQNVE